MTDWENTLWNGEVAVCLKSVANDIVMHITAINLIAVDRNLVSTQLEKVVENNCLVTQGFVKDNNRIIAEILAETAKKLEDKKSKLCKDYSV